SCTACLSVISSVLCPRLVLFFFFFYSTATPVISPLSLHDALPISAPQRDSPPRPPFRRASFRRPSVRPRARPRRCGHWRGVLLPDRKSKRLKSHPLPNSVSPFSL